MTGIDYNTQPPVGGGINNIAQDATPQLGGQLDVNGNCFGDGTNELLCFVETASAVNEITITNASTGNSPSLTATGDNTNISITIDGKGSGVVIADGRTISTDGAKLDTIQTNADVTDASSVAAAGALFSVAGDATPQLGGQLDVNGQSLGDGTRELLSFVEIAFAVNELTITNAAAGNSPSLTATGNDVDISLTISGKGTGVVTVDGRTVSTDGTKLDTIETNADVTDATNVNAAGAVIHSDISEAEGFLRKTGSETYEAIKSNLSASAAPTVDDDVTLGYAVGSQWLDTTADRGYILLDATDGAAVWKEITAQPDGGLLTIEEDTVPKLGGQLDVNGNCLGDGILELLCFVEVGSAVNELTITNAVTDGSPTLTATGDDINISMTISGKGSGTVTVDGRVISTDGTKLDGIATSADVTAAGNVAAAGAVMDSDISAAEGFLRKTGTGAYEAIKSNLDAVSAPTVNDDVTKGYAIGSRWIDIVPFREYICLNVSPAGFGVWRETTPSLVGDPAPTLGGQLNVNGNCLGDGTNELLCFVDVASAVNELTITNASTGNSPSLTATGDNADINMTIAGKGSGVVIVDGRTISFDGAKLDAIENSADVTDAGNVAAAGAVMDSDISEAEGFLRKISSGTYEAIKSNLSASVAPTANEDSGDGYAVGSRWIDTTADREYVLLDATVAAAVWKETTVLVSDLTITATNDSGSGMVIGNVIFFETDGDASKAQANAASTMLAVGFALGTIVLFGSGEFQVSGVMTATLAEWNAVTEEGAGGLTPGTKYFVSEITAGKITTTAPSGVGEFIVQIGIALTSTRLKITDTLQVAL